MKKKKPGKIEYFEAVKGVSFNIEQGKIVAETEQLKGTHIYFDVVSVGATINVMMAAAMAEGTTIMENVAKEPHVVDIANFLNSMGANIRGAGTNIIKIKGVSKLHKTEYSIIPDQIEAGTFMFAAAATKGDVVVKNVIYGCLLVIFVTVKERNSFSRRVNYVVCDSEVGASRLCASVIGNIGNACIFTSCGSTH